LNSIILAVAMQDTEIEGEEEDHGRHEAGPHPERLANHVHEQKFGHPSGPSLKDGRPTSRKNRTSASRGPATVDHLIGANLPHFKGGRFGRA
jgi:hypothetical protein